MFYELSFNYRIKSQALGVKDKRNKLENGESVWRCVIFWQALNVTDGSISWDYALWNLINSLSGLTIRQEGWGQSKGEKFVGSWIGHRRAFRTVNFPTLGVSHMWMPGGIQWWWLQRCSAVRVEACCEVPKVLHYRL